MNCLEFRRDLATDPTRIDGAMKAHAGGCAACAGALRHAAAAEAALGKALALDLPGGLSEQLGRIPAGSPSAIERLRARMGTAGLAAAAMLLAGVLAAGSYWTSRPPPPPPGPTLDSAIVQLIRDEFWTLTTTGRIDAEELSGTLATVGLRLREPVDNVRFATNCVIRGKTAAHWVLEGERAPITVLLMPEETLTGPTAIVSGSLRGILLPVRVGSIALVGTKGEKLEEVSRRIMRAVDWNA